MKLRKEREGMCDMTDEEVQEAEEYSNMLAKRVQELTTELTAANARIAELERCCVVGNLPWKPGNLRSEFYDGERFFVALRVGTGEGEKRREWWDFFVVQASCDEVAPLRFTSEPEDWGWEWEDVEWFIELDDLISTLPPESVPEGEK